MDPAYQYYPWITLLPSSLIAFPNILHSDRFWYRLNRCEAPQRPAQCDPTIDGAPATTSAKRQQQHSGGLLGAGGVVIENEKRVESEPSGSSELCEGIAV